MRRRCGQRHKIAFRALLRGLFAGGIEYRISHRTDVRVNTPEVAQHVEMKRGGLDGLGPAFAKTVQMPFGGCKLGIAQCSFLGEKFARPIRSRRTRLPISVRFSGFESKGQATAIAGRSMPLFACVNAVSRRAFIALANVKLPGRYAALKAVNPCSRSALRSSTFSNPMWSRSAGPTGAHSVAVR
jgi:hypothetical protein